MLTITISTRTAVLTVALLALLVAAVPFAISRAEDGDPAATETRAPVSTAFQYQGRLELNGIPANGTHQIGFTLYSDPVADAPVGNPITATVPVTDGLFSVPLDFGNGIFTGDARWLGVEVLVGNTFVSMGSRQAVRATPYAIHAITSNTAGHSGTADFAASSQYSVTTGTHDHMDESWISSGGIGSTGLALTSTDYNTTTLKVTNTGNCDAAGRVCYGVYADADFFDGGSGYGGVGVRGDGSNAGVLGIGPQFGVYGSSSNVAIRGESSGGTALYASSSGLLGGQYAARVDADGSGASTGLIVRADGMGIDVQTQNAYSIFAQSFDVTTYSRSSGQTGTGVHGVGTGSQGTGVKGSAPNVGVWGNLTDGSGWAGYFDGGGVWSQGGYSVPSDLRLKHDVRDLETALATVMALRPVRYQYNATEGEHIGLIAQEVQELLPELVSVDPMTEDGMLGMNYTELIPVLIKAIQELEERVAELEAGAP